MMKVQLMNSAMMPRPGTYQMWQISKADFAAFVKAANAKGILISSIGYPQNADIIASLTGVNIPLSRERTHISSGDEMLIMTLPYRPDNKGGKVDEDSFEYYKATFK